MPLLIYKNVILYIISTSFKWDNGNAW